jgi:hypothetical protein
MTIEAEVQKIMDDALPAIVKNMRKIATDANASATYRLEAIGVLLTYSRACDQIGKSHQQARMIGWVQNPRA